MVVCNSTIAENEADGSGLSRGGGGYAFGLVDPGGLYVDNSIFWDDIAPDGGFELFLEGNTQLVVAYDDVKGTGGTCPLWDQGDAVDFSGTPDEVCAVGTHLAVDPSFEDPLACDFHIESTSLVRDQGDPAGGCGVFDIDLEDRVCDFIVDMGADEVCE